MSSKIEIETANEIKLQVITSEKRKAMLHSTNIQNASTFMDTTDREFWRVAKNSVQLGPNTFGLDWPAVFMTKMGTTSYWNDVPDWPELWHTVWYAKGEQTVRMLGYWDTWLTISYVDWKNFILWPDDMTRFVDLISNWLMEQSV